MMSRSYCSMQVERHQLELAGVTVVAGQRSVLDSGLFVDQPRLGVLTGTATGPVFATLEVFAAEPDAEPQGHWGAHAEVTVETEGEVSIRGAVARHAVTRATAPGRHRLRLFVHGRDAPFEFAAREASEAILVQLWPV